jgi:uroporphyrinogen-III synthase
MASLQGTRVAVLEARMGTELASLIERSSGVPYCVPALRVVAGDQRAEVAAAIGWLGEGEARLAVLLNGAGVDALFRVAAEIQREQELLAALGRAERLCRGPKPIAALKKRGLAPTVRVEEPYTTRDVLQSLAGLSLRGREVLVLHYGERNEPIVNALSEAGANVRELSLYAWELPEDLGPLARLIDEIIERRVGAVVFTSQIQARHLVIVAEREHKKDALVQALRTHTLVAAIGPTCAEVLASLGIPPHVVPLSPKMGPLVQSLAQRVAGDRPG